MLQDAVGNLIESPDITCRTTDATPIWLTPSCMIYTLVMADIAVEKAIEIVSFPINDGNIP